ncbi:glycosyltransferase family A protein, partial [Campylobacter jejuni]
APDIDYIIFLDSDDYWELNCIEECVPRMDGVEVVWFDYNKIYEKDCLEKKDEWTWFNCYNMGIKKDIIISDEWLDKYCNIQTFAFVWSGMIAFNYLSNQKIKFLDYIFHQDVYFGFMVFFKSNKISLLNKKIINYRIRSNATTLRQGKIGEQIILPKYLDFLSKFYNKNEDAKKYYSLFSWSKMVEKAIEDSFYDEKNIIINYFLPSLCMQLFQKDINKNLDPLNIGIYINFSKVIFKMFRLKHQNIIFNTNLYGTAKQRIQNQLCYKLGQTMIINSKSIIGILFMPIYLLSTFLNYKQDQKIYHQKIKKDPTLKLPPLENYPDYQEALKYKEHLSYKLGKILLESFKTWHKGGLFKFPFLAKGVKKYA